MSDPDPSIAASPSGGRTAPGPGPALRVAAAALLVLLGASPGPASATEEPAADGALTTAGEDPAAPLADRRSRTEAELRELSRRIGLSRQKAAELEAEVESLAEDTASLRTALVESAARRKALEETSAAQEARLAGLREREDGIRGSLRARRGVLAEVLAAIQRMGRDPPPALLVQPGDALASVRSAILLGAVVPQMRAETAALVADLEDLAAVRASISRQRADITATLAEMAEEERRLELLLAEKDRRITAGQAELAAERESAARLAARATDMEGLIASLESEIRSVREAAERARRAEEERRRQTAEQLARARERAERDSPDKNRIAPAYAFSGLKGLLALPVAGRPVGRYGDDDGSGHRLQGLLVAARPGALVTAPADGWVVYAGPFRSYGQLVILNVGDGYHVVLAGMDRITVNQGQFVVAGEPVAEMGSTRLAGAAALALVSDQPTLYIEFRKNGKPVDSRPWWSNSLSGRVSNGS